MFTTADISLAEANFPPIPRVKVQEKRKIESDCLSRKHFNKYYYGKQPVILKSSNTTCRCCCTKQQRGQYTTVCRCPCLCDSPCLRSRLNPSYLRDQFGAVDVLLSTVEQEAYKTCKLASFHEYLQQIQYHGSSQQIATECTDSGGSSIGDEACQIARNEYCNQRGDEQYILQVKK